MIDDDDAFAAREPERGTEPVGLNARRVGTEESRHLARMRRHDGRPRPRTKDPRVGDGVETVRVEDERRAGAADDVCHQFARRLGKTQPRAANDRRPAREKLVRVAAIGQRRRAVARVGKRRRHRLPHVALHDRLERRRDRQGREAGACPPGSRRREQRGARLAT